MRILKKKMGNAVANGVSRFSLIFPPFRVFRKIGGGWVERIRGLPPRGWCGEVGDSIGEGYAG